MGNEESLKWGIFKSGESLEARIFKMGIFKMGNRNQNVVKRCFSILNYRDDVDSEHFSRF